MENPPTNADYPAGPRPDGPAATLDKLYIGFKSKFADVPEVTVQELHSWMQAESDVGPALLLVDVRTREEQQVSMLPGAATMTQRDFEAQGPGAFGGRRIVCYCTAGYRSGLFAQKLRREYGLEAYNLKGSILAWTQAGLPLADPRDGATTARVHVFSKDWALQGEGYSPVMFQRPLLRLLLDAIAGWWRSAVAALRWGKPDGQKKTGGQLKRD